MPLRSRLVVPLLLALCAVNPGVRADAAAGGASAKEPNLVVMTFNIRYGTADDDDNRWEKRKDLVFNLLRRQGPDVIGLQEALRFQIDEIRAALPQYGEVGVGRDDGKTGGEYSAILYRKDRLDVNDCGTFWLSDTPEVCGSITWGNACTRVCTWGRFTRNGSGQAFYLFNTHLDHISQYSRDRSALLLAERIYGRKCPDPVVVTGDFNVGEDNPVVQYLTGRLSLYVAKNGLAENPAPLVDTFRVLHADASDVGTFNEFKGKCTGPKIDYIFAQPGIEVRDAAIVRDGSGGRYPSDHFPVMAVLALTKTASH
jgi:endonuclease/exonuclease/phosphatase family metal-dependent hydrolase